MRIDPESGEDALNFIDRVGSLLWQINFSGKGSHRADFVHVASVARLILLNRSNCPTAPWKHIKQQWRLVRQSRTATSLQTQQLNHKLQNMLTCSHWRTTQQNYEDAIFLTDLLSCHLMRESPCLHSWTSFACRNPRRIRIAIFSASINGGRMKPFTKHHKTLY